MERLVEGNGGAAPASYARVSTRSPGAAREC